MMIRIIPYYTVRQMKPEEYEGNTQYMRYEYHRVREGPNYFVSYYKNSSRLIYDPKDTWRTLGTAKFTDTGKNLKEWCLLMDETYGVPQRDKWITHEATGASEGHDEGVAEASGRKDTSFASEAMGDEQSSLEEDNPCSNTKMVT